MTARWHDDVHLPTEPGVYYWETCTDLGHPLPGLYLWEEGKPPQFPHTGKPFKMFGPIPGAMKEWPMVAMPPAAAKTPEDRQ